jgi:hypothetical protein
MNWRPRLEPVTWSWSDQTKLLGNKMIKRYIEGSP